MCWQQSPDKRPTFAELSQNLTKMFRFTQEDPVQQHQQEENMYDIQPMQ